ncbi:hypothetical protein TR631_10035 [Streptomyces rochei]|uniref:hypothetical protein n=1 Tax=Streptomyces TaxID=1883 RepID=UPI001B379628|nr:MULTISPECIES: hypothetical protein [Streptomyces]MBQ0882696.1 hypothetical protein [Streptomyces sp. RT42]WQC12124.1 hypothetical protein TR631_10035 [Streptomyces rochei]
MPALLLLVLVAVATAVLLRRGTGTYPPVRTFPAVGRAPREPGAPFRVLAVVAGWAAGLLYVWGLLITGLTVLEAEDGGTDSSPLRPCRAGVSPELAGRVVDYSVSYLPLRFSCETADGGSYDSADIPGYVNPGVAALALTAAASAVAAGYASERRARAASRDAGA